MVMNKAGKDTKTIGLNMKQEMAEEIERRAKSMHFSTGAYCKVILGEWLKSGKKLRLEFPVQPPFSYRSFARRGGNPLPSSRHDFETIGMVGGRVVGDRPGGRETTAGPDL